MPPIGLRFSAFHVPKNHPETLLQVQGHTMSPWPLQLRWDSPWACSQGTTSRASRSLLCESQ